MSATATMTQAKVAPASAAAFQAASKPKLHSHSLLASFVPPKGAARIITQKELADNCGIGSASGRAWIALHGHVFDITQFSKTHPGGQAIRLGAGRDGTCLVESYHPGSSLVKVEAALFKSASYVGLLQCDETKAETKPAPGAVAAYKRPDDAFFLDVRARVEHHINVTLGSSRYSYEMLGLCEAAVTLLLYAWASYQIAVHGSWMWTIILGFLQGRMGFLMHMGTHLAISKNAQYNKCIGEFMDLIGSNAIIWGYEHQVAHHGEPNEYHKDNDCEIGNPVVRMHPEIPHTDSQKYQHIIVPIAMTIGFFKWYIGDFSSYLAKQVGNVRMAIDSEDWKRLLAFKGAWFLVHVILPFYFNGWGKASAQLFVFMALGGHYLENIFIVNHIQNGLVPPASAHWASKQVMATCNWQSGSFFWNWVSGGLNHQVEHHMFPSLSQYWYPHISHIVKQTCADHGLPYVNFPTFSDAWVEMWTYLRDMGDPHFVSKTGMKGAPPATAAQVEGKKVA